MDPRLAGMDSRLAAVHRIVAVTGGKGGIGKSFVSSSLALALAGAGRRVGLLDLDLTAPTDHVILGAPTGFPDEEFGVDPPLVHGIRFMSIAHFSREAPAPLRGQDVTNALLELLAITRWGELDVLVVDMPPGLGDAALDLFRLLGRAEYLVLATASPVVLETVRRNLGLLRRVEATVVGVLENMRRRDSTAVADLARAFEVPYLGAVPFDDALDAAVGDAGRLATTRAMAAVRACAEKVAG